MRFTWNSRKAAQNRKKHGVSFEEAITVFSDRTAVIFDDDKHSDDEYREFIIGFSQQSRLLVIFFVERDNTIRIISARRATQIETTNHEKAKR